MTSVINNEFLNSLLREGEGLAALTALPSIDSILDPQGHLLQRGSWVPLLDALRAIVACAQRLLEAAARTNDTTVGVYREALQQLLHGLVCLDPVQGDLLEPKTTLKQRIQADRKTLKACHLVAASIAQKLEKDPRTTFESYAAMLAASPDPAVTMRMLAHAGKDTRPLMDSSGPLPAIDKPVVPTLPAGQHVELRVRVLRVDDRTNDALVERVQALDEASERLLVHHRRVCLVRFDGDAVERADLTAAQYLSVPIRIRCAAECSILPGLEAKSTLTLAKVLEAREVMDALHKSCRQYQARLLDER